MSNRRNNLDVTADILRTAHSGAIKTRIVYQANLNFDIVKKYLKTLLENGMLRHDGRYYYATEKGATYLSRYEALQSL